MNLNGILIIVRVIISAIIAIYPLTLLVRLLYKGSKNLNKYIVSHAKETKAIKSFQKDNFVQKVNKVPEEDTEIFEEKKPLKKAKAGVSNSTNISNSSEKKESSQAITSNTKSQDTSSSSHTQKSGHQSNQHAQAKKPEATISQKRTEAQKTEDKKSHVDFRRKQRLDQIKIQATMLKSKGKHDEYEKKIIEGMAVEEKESGEFTKLLADWYFHLGKYTKALTLLKQILASEPKHHRSLWQVAEIHLEKGDFNTAKILIDKAISLAPADPKYHVTLVEVYYNMDQLQKAIGHMHKVCKLRPNNVNYLMGMAGLYEEAKDFPEAKKYYLKVVHLDPSNEGAKRKIKYL